MQVFDLTEIQADYILEMPLRRLTKFSRIELEKEQSELEGRSRGSTRSSATSSCAEGRLRRAHRGGQDLRHPAPDRAARVGRDDGHRVRSPLEVADDPCFVYLSSTGLLARTTSDEAARPGRRARQPRRDRVRRSHDGARRGRRAHQPRPGGPAERARAAPATLPATANDPHLQGGLPVSEVLSLESRRARARAHARCDRRTRVWRSAPARASSSGSTRRCSGKDEWEVIRLKDGDEVVGAVELAHRRRDAVLHHLRRPAAALRRRRRSVPRAAPAAASPACGSPAGEQVVWFGSLDPGRVPSSSPRPARPRRCPAPSPARVKVTPFSEYPAKGRATGGVRCHRFLKGEDTLVFAWAGAAPGARRRGQRGARRPARSRPGRRDGSGTPGSQPIAACAGPSRPRSAARDPCARLTRVLTPRGLDSDHPVAALTLG